jgi:hypothetical protein
MSRLWFTDFCALPVRPACARSTVGATAAAEALRQVAETSGQMQTEVAPKVSSLVTMLRSDAGLRATPLVARAESL